VRRGTGISVFTVDSASVSFKYEKRGERTMKVQFECSCSEEISEFTRGETSRGVHVECGNCGAVYAVTITELE
jgi:transcription elongation factor Elf1